jgi:hypothetical protein
LDYGAQSGWPERGWTEVTGNASNDVAMWHSLDDLTAMGITSPIRSAVAEFTLDGVRFGQLSQVPRKSSVNETRLEKRSYYEPYAVASALVALGYVRLEMFVHDKPDIRAVIGDTVIGIEQADILDQGFADAKHTALDIERGVRDLIASRCELSEAMKGLSLIVSFMHSPKGHTRQLVTELTNLIEQRAFNSSSNSSFLPSLTDAPALFSSGARINVGATELGSSFAIMYGSGIHPIATPARELVREMLEKKQRLATKYDIRPLWLFMTVLDGMMLTANEVHEVATVAGSLEPFKRLVVYSDASGIVFDSGG